MDDKVCASLEKIANSDQSLLVWSGPAKGARLKNADVGANQTRNAQNAKNTDKAATLDESR